MYKILAVDDDIFSLQLVSRILQSEYEVIAVSSGDEAIAWLKENSADLLLLDYYMPGKNGLETLREIRRNEKDAATPAIFITGERDITLEVTCFREGAEDVIRKPYAPEVVSSRVGRTMELYRLRSQLEKKLDEKTEQVEKLSQQTMRDVLTGLYNRFYAQRAVDISLERKCEGVFLMVDLDNFKQVNDQFGHVAGDFALKKASEVLLEITGEGGIACRMGGDEFAIFVDHAMEREKIEDLCDRILQKYVKTIDSEPAMDGTSLSIGITIAGQDGANFEELYNAADKALYFAKRNGKNRYCFYSDDMPVEECAREQVIDIQTLSNIIQENRTVNGSYQVPYADFRRIYNYVSRSVARTNQAARLLLLSLNGGEETEEGQKRCEEEMYHLEQAVVSSLRRNDVSARYSATQIMVVLMDVTEETIGVVIHRIREKFMERKRWPEFQLQYQDTPVKGSGGATE